ncbi:transglycosylase domain-containing protein [Pseudostreptobacillus hongkongensis]|uniref:transglycosylase domain-containing protein n=1 Tax=Pseudostreptobacillus hongkongensis TaxID=1162717 RepID=UPI0028D89F79|nr:transglycosylase domain-containing protein [Pseudostreptobacillus hongkongensis]
MKKIIKYLSIFIGSLVVIFGLGLVYVIHEVNQKYPPELINNYKPLTPSVIYDINGNQLDLITIENRDPIDIDQIPEMVQNAFISVEDKRFREHNGLDYIRLTKALILNVTKTGREGGSTITQQLVKNVFLSPDRTLKRKIVEAVLATRMERKLTKDEILELYLNTINFGRGVYGIKNASLNYFNKLPKDLTVGEAAILASIPKSPTKYSKLENAIQRQKVVLKLMYENKAITKEEYDKAKDEKITFVNRTNINKNNEEKISSTNIAPEFTTIILSEVKKILNIETEEDEKLLFNGYKIYATVDINMQKAAYKAFATNSNLNRRSELEAALISIDPSNGFVKAMVGGKNYIKGDFNRALRAKRQPGSSFKPFIYLADMLENYTMATTLEDSPTTFGKWTPRNYDAKYRNNLTLLKALEISDNVVAVKALDLIGIKNFINLWESFGFDRKEVPQDLTVALGSITLSPLDMAKAYSIIANGGEKVEPQFIYKIENKFGEVIYEAETKKEKVLEPEYAALVTHMMQSVVKNGGSKGAQLYANGKMVPVAGKTGTTSDYVSAWFTGYTPTLVTVVYVGNDNNKSMGRGMSGAIAALPIWKNYMQIVANLSNFDIGKFQFIDDNLSNGKLIKKVIDLKTGLLDSDGNNSREALFIKGTEPIEYENIIYEEF